MVGVRQAMSCVNVFHGKSIIFCFALKVAKSNTAQ
jgi:hypothetical protein